MSTSKIIFKRLRKPAILSLVIYVLPLSLASQGVPIRWSGEIFKPASSCSFKVIGNWEEGIMMQSRTGDRIFSPGKTFIQRLDNITMLPQFNRQVQLETSKGDKTLEYQVLERLGNKSVLFATYFNKSRDRIELFGRKYNLEGEPEGKEKKIAEFNATRKSQVERLNFVHSADSSRMLAFFSERWDKYAKEKIQFILFDSLLQTTLNRSVEFPYEGNQFSVHDAALDRSGRIFLLVRIEAAQQKSWKRNKPDYRYSMVTFDSDSGLVKDFEINIGDKRLVDIRFIPEKDGKITCSGFYASPEAFQAEGLFFLRIDIQTGAVTQKRIMPFEPSFTARFNNGNRRNKNNAILPDFKLDQFIQFGDSGYAIIGEQYLVDEICFQDFRTGMMTCNYIYNYNNIAVMKLDTAGQVEWAADIPKFQETANDGGKYSSYVFGHNQNNIYFIFNDHPANTKIEDERKIAVMTEIQRAVPVLVSMDKNGHYNRIPLQESKRNKFWMIPSGSCQISQQSILLVAASSNKYKTGIVSLTPGGNDE